MNILSIKGGGARGIISIRLLVEVEKRTGVSIAKLFDYVGGSSIGTLTACGLLVTDDGENPLYSAQQVYDIFLKQRVEAFSWSYSSWVSSLFGLLGPTYTHDGLKDIVRSTFQERTMTNLLKPIIFPAYDKKTGKAYYFDKKKNANVKISDVILSCTSAPTYFPSYNLKIEDKEHFMIDGGVVVNNTAELVYLKATENMKYVDKTSILELTIGTGNFTYRCVKDGLLSWAPIIVDLFMNGSSDNELYELSLSLPEGNYYMMDVLLDFKYDYMDKTDDKTIGYYIEATEKWILDNDKEIDDFCHKLLKNKGL